MIQLEEGGGGDFFIDNIFVRIHFIIVMKRLTGLALWEFQVPFSGSLTSTFLEEGRVVGHDRCVTQPSSSFSLLLLRKESNRGEEDYSLIITRELYRRGRVIKKNKAVAHAASPRRRAGWGEGCPHASNVRRHLVFLSEYPLYTW